jgi:multiple sugar transport system permease protein/fructooligosaccharide transport system permease protein
MKRALQWAASAAVAGVFLAPLLWLLAASLVPTDEVFRGGWARLFFDGGWTLTNYASAWRRAALARSLAVSIFQATVIGGLGLVVNSLAAYAFARLHFRGREALFAVVVALLILPIEVLVVPLLLTVRGLGLTGGATALAGLTLPFVAKAFNVYFLRQHFLSVPRELEEAGALDGASSWRQFWDIALPSVRPALLTVLVLDLLMHWGDFLWPLVISTRAETRTVQLGLASLFTEPPIDWGAIMACAVVTTLPVIGLFRVLERFVVATDPRAGLR